MQEIDAVHYFKTIMVIQQGPKSPEKEFLGVWQIYMLAICTFLILVMSMLMVLLSLKTSCVGKIQFLSFDPKIILDNQIAWVFNIEFLQDGLIVYFIFCMMI